MKLRLLFVCLILSSCTLYKVSDKDNQGIPFFSQQIVETVTQTYRESYCKVIVSRKWETGPTENSKKKKEFSTTAVKYFKLNCGIELNNKFSFSKDMISANKVVQEYFNAKENICNDEFGIFLTKDINKVLQLSDENLGLRRISEDRTRKTVIDPKPKYINIRKSLTGTTDSKITLNNNGTLATVEAESTEELVGKVIDQLPIGTFVSNALDLIEIEKTEDKTAITENAQLISIQLEVIPIYRDYIVTVDCILKDSYSSNPGPSKDYYSSFKIVETVAKKLNNGSNPPKPTKEPDNQIKLNGTIILPKAEEKK